MSSFTVALTGASGSIYGVRLVGELLSDGHDVDLIISPSALLVIEHELGVSLDTKNYEEGFLSLVKGSLISQADLILDSSIKGTLTCHDYNNIASKLASGSTGKKNMIIVPCSMGTLARIATGMSSNLIERAADCVIKEGVSPTNGNLTLVPRETPLSAIHLENMLKLSRLGIKIIPAMPGFYNKPQSIDDMVNFVIGKVLDSLGVENNLFKRWNP